MEDAELIKTLFADKIVTISKSNYPTQRVARFKNLPEEILDKLTPYWGQFEWILDETQPV